jgi:hypothetical protein
MSRQTKEIDLWRFKGTVVFIEEATHEIKQRKKCFYLQDVAEYIEFINQDFESVGEITRVTLNNGTDNLVVMPFEEFNKIHDNFILEQARAEKGIILKNNN